MGAQPPWINDIYDFQGAFGHPPPLLDRKNPEYKINPSPSPIPKSSDGNFYFDDLKTVKFLLYRKVAEISLNMIIKKRLTHGP